MTMSGVLIECHFLPGVEYFCALEPFETICLEAHEHYVKQSYRNRCYILAVHGPERLTIPIAGNHGKIPMKEVRIDYAYRWQANFWRTIQSAYAKAPFFEHYSNELHQVIFSGEPMLFQFNQTILSLCLQWLRWKKVVTESASYQPETQLTDLRNVISVKTGFDTRTILQPKIYSQVFGSTFVPNLSILDLVCCMGPEAGRVITDSNRTALNK